MDSVVVVGDKAFEAWLLAPAPPQVAPATGATGETCATAVSPLAVTTGWLLPLGEVVVMVSLVNDELAVGESEDATEVEEDDHERMARQ